MEDLKIPDLDRWLELVPFALWDLLEEILLCWWKNNFLPLYGFNLYWAPFPVLTFQTFSVILKSISFSSKYVRNNCRSSGELGECTPDSWSTSVLGSLASSASLFSLVMLHVEEGSQTTCCQMIAVLFKKHVDPCLFSRSFFWGHTHTYSHKH